MGPRIISLSSFATEGWSADVLACSILLGTTMLVAYISKKYQWIYFPESSAALVLGMCFGALTLRLEPSLAFTFSPEIFFYGLLPIIIFNAGYGLKKRDFFRNFATITLFAVVGTVISALVYGLLTYLLIVRGYITHMGASGSPLLESLMFGSLISAIDPVATLSIFQDVEAPTLLYNIVFGESLVNDASSIVLFRTFETFLNEPFGMTSIAQAILRFLLISFGSIGLGVAVSLVGALALRFVEIRTEFVKFELSLVLVSAYVSYSVAELLSLSGIMALFFCGICNAHYSYYSTTHASKISSKYAFEALSFMAEMFTFSYLGMQVVVQNHVLDRGLLLSAIPLCFLSRAANVFPLAWLTNRTRRKKIPNKMKVMMWFSGLRGAVAFALSVNLPVRTPAIETATLFIVVTTTVLLGGSTAPLLHALGLVSSAPGGEGDKPDVTILRAASLTDVASHPDSELAGFHEAFKSFDSKFLKPVFGGKVEADISGTTSILGDFGQLQEHKGPGFALGVPANWVPLPPSPSVLFSFASPQEDSTGVPEAEVDGILFALDSAEELEGSDPATFLLNHWDRMCPELSAPSPPDIAAAPNEAGATGHPHRIDYDALSGSPNATMPAERRSPWLARSSSNRPGRSSAGHRVVPAFVARCDHSIRERRGELFQYEIVAHPEDLGAHRGMVRHFFLGVWGDLSRVYVCRVKVSEAFMVDGGVMVAMAVLDSFSLQDSV